MEFWTEEDLIDNDLMYEKTFSKKSKIPTLYSKSTSISWKPKKTVKRKTF
jgi:hypothetical protein